MQVSYSSLFVCFDLYPRHIAPALMLQRIPPQADQDRKDEPVFGAGILSRLRCKTAFLSRQKHDVKSGAFPLCQLQIGTGKLHPELVSEWSEKNLPLTPDDITFQRLIIYIRFFIRFYRLLSMMTSSEITRQIMC